MSQQEIYQTIETQLSQLDEREQERVLMYIRTLLDQRSMTENPDLNELEELVAIGKGKYSDGAEEHDHYIYGVPKRISAK
ncbi:MAG: hypothetical protein EPO24_14895 [Bacteroidetes bacterium]|nr:MAG: hypothetical protein EPO24_14895 [Bacteroidota bacterium]